MPILTQENLTMVAYQLFEELKEANYVIVASPKLYDPDSACSCLLIKELLSHQGMGIPRPYTLFCAQELTAAGNPLLKFIETELDSFSTTIPHYTTPLCIVVVDHGSFRTCHLDPAIYQNIPHRFIGIDHHPQSAGFPENSIQIIDTDAASTTAMIYNLLRHRIPITRRIATYTALGLMADIGGKLTHPKVGAETLRILTNCIDKGIPWEEIQEAAKPKMTPQRLNVWIKAKEYLNCQAKYFVSLVVYKLTLARWAGTKKDVETFFGTYMCALEDMDMTVLIFEQDDGTWKISFRSKGSRKNQAAELAQIFNGGGHTDAAAATYRGCPFDAERMILAYLEQKTKRA